MTNEPDTTMTSSIPSHSQADLAQLAERQFASAHASCDGCLAYHALWPYLRLTGLVGGVEADQAYLMPLLSDVLGSTPRRVLIAGSADSGLTALVHRAAGASAALHAITVVDRCDTPLSACRQYGIEHGLSIRTLSTDLRRLDLRESADLVVCHSILPFMDATDRHLVLCRLFDALAPGGQMVLSTRLAAPGQSTRLSRKGGPGWVTEAMAVMQTSLQRQGIELPCPVDRFEALVDTYLQGHHSVPYAQQSELEAELGAAGFRVERWTASSKGNVFPDNGHIQPSVRQGVVAVTRPK